MSAVPAFFTSSIGRKWAVAVSGVVLVAFVVGHMIGNLQIFLGPDAINRYGAFLHASDELLWAVRVVLLAMLVIHVVATVQLRMENRAARPVRYQTPRYVRATAAARWMLLSGLMVLCFVVFHLLHFTVQSIDPAFLTLHDAKGRHDVYRMVVLGFSNKLASGFYIVGVGLLATHLNHGFQSMFQTLGLNTTKLAPGLIRAAQVVAWVLFLGYAVIPVAVLTGLVK